MRRSGTGIGGLVAEAGGSGYIQIVAPGGSGGGGGCPYNKVSGKDFDRGDTKKSTEKHI
jgi:hypothetical protein